MNNRQLRFFLVFISTLFIIACAKRGSIGGGPLDMDPPVFLRSTPPNLSTDFNANEIRIYFNELVTVKDPQNVLVSPPMKIKPEISPVGFPSKYVKIKFKDTLKPETTYNINFGSSIVDNNESNPVAFFQFVFSTGKVLDSLTFKGSVKDAFNKELPKNISVHLYEVNEAYTDSTIFKEFPRYVSNTLDSTIFDFKNLKAGKYKLVALEDKASNYTFEPRLDKIGFLEKTISIPEDSIAELTIFKEEPEFKYVRAKQVSKHQFSIGYEGKLENPEISVLGTPKDSLVKTTFYKDPKKDSLNLWVTPFFEQDSLLIVTKSKTTLDTLVSRYKDQYADSLKLRVVSKRLTLKEDMVITANTPISELNTEFVNLIDQDTLPVDFTQKYDRFKNELRISFPKKEESKYALKLLPGALTDFIGNANDTIVLNSNTVLESVYGTLVLTFNKTDNSSLIIQLLQGNNVSKEVLVSGSENSIEFKSLNAGEYDVRVIFDENSNGVRDTGNYLKQIQPEKIFYHNKTITVRANWDVTQNISF